jgi:hypothetical protein
MINEWVAAGGEVETNGVDRLFMNRARKQIETSRRPNPATLEPELVYATD